MSAPSPFQWQVAGKAGTGNKGYANPAVNAYSPPQSMDASNPTATPPAPMSVRPIAPPPSVAAASAPASNKPVGFDPSVKYRAPKDFAPRPIAPIAPDTQQPTSAFAPAATTSKVPAYTGFKPAAISDDKFAAGITSMADNPLAQLGLQYGKGFVDSTMAKYIPGLANLWQNLKYYFDVDNKYVLSKLKILLFPFRHPRWYRISPQELQQTGSLSTQIRFSGPDSQGVCFASPVTDTNAPDLYIPLMAFITLVLAIGLGKGVLASFHPEDLVSACSRVLLLMALEIIVTKISMFAAGVAKPSPVLDLVAFSGYKYVLLVITTCVRIYLGKTLSWIALLYTMGTTAFFIVNTLNPIFKPSKNPYLANTHGNAEQIPGGYAGLSQGSSKEKTKSYVLLGMGALQLLTVYWLASF